MERFVKKRHLKSLETFEQSLRRHYASNAADLDGADFGLMARNVVLNSLSHQTTCHRSVSHKTKWRRIRWAIGPAMLTLGLLTASVVVPPGLVQAAYVSLQRFTIPLSVLKSADPQKLKAILNSFQSPRLSEFGNPLPAKKPVVPSETSFRTRGVTGPFNVTAENGRASLLSTVPTLKGGIAVAGDFFTGGYIICRAIHSGQIYTGSVKAGVVSARSDYIAVPPGTYDVYVASVKSGPHSYSSMNVYFR